jgi:GT2 family glycosyltransferase
MVFSMKDPGSRPITESDASAAFRSLRVPVDISVVIVNWNTRELLLDCVESLIEQTRESSLEIIVVDNASRDGSMEALSERFPEVVSIRNLDNLGFSKANNQGLRIARGRFLCLVNSDVKALDGVLDKLRAFLEDQPDVGAVAPRTVGGDLKLRRNCREYPTIRNAFCEAVFLDQLFPSVRVFRGRILRGYDYATTQEIEVLSGCFLMVRREVIEKVGMLDERFFIYSEDVDWCRRIRAGGWKVVFFPGAEAIHYGGSSSTVERVRFNREMVKANLQYWRKHHGRAAALLIWAFQILGAALRAVGWSVLTLIRFGHSRCRDQAIGYWRVLQWLLTGGLQLAAA